MTPEDQKSRKVVQLQEVLVCDYSLQAVKSRPAKVGDRLTVTNFGTGTRGFSAPEDRSVAVCVLPGTEMAFDSEIQESALFNINGLFSKKTGHCTARFRQLDKDKERVHHDALELPDGRQIFLTNLTEGQTASVLQLPAEPRNEQEKEDQRRVEYAG